MAAAVSVKQESSWQGDVRSETATQDTSQ